MYSITQIMEDFNQRKTKTFAIIHHRFFRSLYVASLKITNNTQESEDIINVIFCRLFTDLHLKQFESIQHLYNYLLTSTRNRSLNFLRVKIHCNENVDEDNYNPIMDMLESSYRQKLYDLKIHKVMSELSLKCIDIIRMIYFEQMTAVDIAKKMNITVSTVFNSKQKGLKLLAKILNEKDFIQ